MGEDKEAKVPAPGEIAGQAGDIDEYFEAVVRCLLYTSPSPRD